MRLGLIGEDVRQQDTHGKAAWYHAAMTHLSSDKQLRRLDADGTQYPGFGWHPQPKSGTRNIRDYTAHDAGSVIADHYDRAGYVNRKSGLAPRLGGFRSDLYTGKISPFVSPFTIGHCAGERYVIEACRDLATGLNPSIRLEMQLAVADSQQGTVESRAVAADRGDHNIVGGFQIEVGIFDGLHQRLSAFLSSHPFPLVPRRQHQEVAAESDDFLTEE
jgi:hypothetical protein